MIPRISAETQLISEDLLIVCETTIPSPTPQNTAMMKNIDFSEALGVQISSVTSMTSWMSTPGGKSMQHR